MVDSNRNFPDGWQLNPPVSDEVLQRSLREIEHNIPLWYVTFVKKYNGGEGFVGERYFIIWEVQELKKFNIEYEVAKYTPGIFLFGSSGGGEGYGFDFYDNAVRIVSVPFIGMNRQDAEDVTMDFTQITKLLGKGEGRHANI